MKIADVNGDGILDLVVADLGTPELAGGGVSILLQDGSNRGSFIPARNYTAGNGPGATIMFQKPAAPGKFFPPRVVGQ